jgi:hypothetical protein
LVDKSEKFAWLVRLGYAARGLVYVMLGYLALSTAREAGDGQSAVFDTIQDVPMGSVLLWLVAIGLLAYAAFKFIDAATDVEHHGNDAKGMAKRVGSAASGVAHVVLAWTAYQFATGTKQQSTGDTGGEEAAASLLAWDMGSLLLGVVGLGFLVAAAMQARHAWNASFMHHVSGRAPRAVEPIGRVGHAARAIVFLLIGWSIVQSAWFEQSTEVMGLGEAITALSDNGSVYTFVAVGLILFGVFSLIVARYRIIPDLGHDLRRPRFRH